MAKTIAVIGAGLLTGLAVARRFGREGFRAALVARRKDSLDNLVQRLEQDGVEAKGFIADVTDDVSLVRAFSDIREAFGDADVMTYSPINMSFVLPTRVTAENARAAFEFLVAGAITSARQVFPSMIERGHGSIIFANGRSAILPMKMIASLSPATAALRGYAYSLHDELKPKGVHVGMVTISTLIDEAHAKSIAELFWRLHVKRDYVEEIYGDDIDAMLQIAQIMRTAR